MDDAILVWSIKEGFNDAGEEALLKMLGIARLDAVFAYRLGVFLAVLDQNPELRAQIERLFGLKLSVEDPSSKKTTRPIHDTAEVSEPEFGRVEEDDSLPDQYYRA
jgi:hypothetical protein